MSLSIHSYHGEDDYWAIREFLRRVFLRNARRDLSWQAARFDYWRWHVFANIEHARLDDVVFIWETAAGRTGAVLNPEGRGEAFFQVHPDLRTRALEEEMLAVAEATLAIDSAGVRQLRVWAHEHDTLRQDILQRHGYAKGDALEYQRRRLLSEAIPGAPPPPGFSVRALGVGAELLERCYASGLVFHPDEIAYALQNRQDVSWYHNIQTAPLYRRDLDLVAIAPDGAVAALATIWFDDVTRCGVFEPVGTVPAYQRRGLGKAVLCEGLRRLQRMGATLATVGSYSAEAHALYSSVGFVDYDLCAPWDKTW